jgi:cation transport regulator ChaC
MTDILGYQTGRTSKVGNGTDYVRDVAKHLDAAGVKDKVVADFL